MPDVLNGSFLRLALDGAQLQIESQSTRVFATQQPSGLSVTAPAVAVDPFDPPSSPVQWNFGATEARFEFAAATLPLPRKSALRWEGLVVTFSQNTLRLKFTRMSVSHARIPDQSLVADVQITLVNGVQTAADPVQLYQPLAARGTLTLSSSPKQVVLQWDAAEPATLRLPGVDITAPAEVGVGAVSTAITFRAVLNGTGLNVFSLSATSGRAVSASSAFAWIRKVGQSDERELVRGPSSSGPPPQVLTLTATPSQSLAMRLMSLDLAASAPPVFFQTETGGHLDSSCQFTLAPIVVTLPFLARGASQSVSVRTSTFPTTAASGTLTGTMDVDVNLAAGLSFPTRASSIGFNVEKFALVVDHDSGISLQDTRSDALPQESMDLSWKVTPASGRPLFTLVTRNSSYRVQLDPQAKVTLGYSHLTRETPVEFVSTDLSLSDNGINLSAEVSGKPARLNGINTSFKFADTRLLIVDSRIQDFTLLGSGPLPPALVGEATANIALQFRQNGSQSLSLVAAAAQLKGTQPLELKSIRFRYPVDALGLKFVDDDGYHLYFTLSGQALFTPLLGDDPDSPLALLAKTRIPLIECPLAGDCTVLAKHFEFLSELPVVIHFEFLGAFTFELKGFGFLPCAEEFDGDPAIKLSGQILFSKANDTKVVDIQFHELLIGLPPAGESTPRLFLHELAVEVKFGEAFRLSGVVEFIKSQNELGFKGEGVLEIKGIPQIAASFGFVRVREDPQSEWKRAWFIFLQVGKISFSIPQIELFLREVGLGFGFRFTLAAIKAADEEDDLGKLVEKLGELSRTAGNLSKKDQWVVDLEKKGEEPRWTIVFRALFTQTSASKSPLKYEEDEEEKLPCVYLFDAIVAFRSDLTFLMAARGWINTNYADFLEDEDDLTEKPIVSGIILLSVRRKRFLAHLASNPDGVIGDHPPLPDFVKDALKGIEFSATLLVEPALFHFELGWPNQLRWQRSFGPVDVEFRGGFIFRIVETTATIGGFAPPAGGVNALLVMGISAQARAHVEISGGFNGGLFGVRLTATLDAAFGGRLTGVTSLLRSDQVAVYANIHLEVRATFELVFWIGIGVLSKEFAFSLSIGITAGVELGLRNLEIGVRGVGTVSFEILGYECHVTAHFSSNESIVDDALNLTSQFLTLGLEAGDVDGTEKPAALASPLGGAVATPQPPAGAGGAGGQAGGDGQTAAAKAALATALAPTTAVVPNYTIFAKRADATTVYFLLMPAGGMESGFLPGPPPNTGVNDDFTVTFPPLAQGGTLEQIRPDFTNADTTPDQQFRASQPSWKANWDASAGTLRHKDTIAPIDLKLGDLLKEAFVNGGDPVPLTATQGPEDSRVQNPTDSAFDAAVRGAYEQFRGSPFFKSDPENPYDQALQAAFASNTTVYTPDGTIPSDAATKEQLRLRESAIHARGLIVHDCVGDFNSYVEGIRQSLPLKNVTQSVPFRMGLVFRIRSTSVLPDWLAKPASSLTDAGRVRITHRKGMSAAAPVATDSKIASTFNVPEADFARFSPKFEHVRQYTSSNTIAIAWDLTWDTPPHQDLTGAQLDPEHYLMNYEVRRRALDGSEPDEAYTVKTGHVLNAGKGGALSKLKARFKVVDHFSHETLQDQASLPVRGRSYLYTITPRDVNGSLGRPLTLVATRLPDEPPRVPAKAELTVSYTLDATTLAPASAASPSAPALLRPQITQRGIPPAPQPPAKIGFARVKWTEPAPGDPNVPIAIYRLIFRRESTIPVGSYGLDSSTRGSLSKSLPTSNSRALPADIKVTLTAAGPRENRSAEIDLVAAGVFPSAAANAAPLWRPEAWTVFFQTESVNGVPSSLAPVQLMLRFESAAGGAEERRPSELEFLPRPIKFPLLPPEDQMATVGPVCVPVPDPGTFQFAAPVSGGSLAGVTYGVHPDGMRAIRFNWNQGPSGTSSYPLDLTAGYRLKQLDIDAETTATFSNADRLAASLRDIQEVQMLPADEVALTPGDTVSTSLWRAWYPSSVKRLRTAAQRRKGSEKALGPWRSWRESMVIWPDWPGFTDAAATVTARPQAYHPALGKIVEKLRTKFAVVVQTSPPIQSANVDGFFKSTGPGSDPYGWGILQRFGLSITIALHDRVSGQLVAGTDAPKAIATAIADARTGLGDFIAFLHVELLFQPARSISLAPAAANASSLLGITQLSLRPAFQELFQYSRAEISGTPGSSVEVHFVLTGPITLVDQSDLSAGEVELTAGAKRLVRIAPRGRTALLMRGRGAAPVLSRVADGAAISAAPFDGTSELAAYFSAPVTQLAAMLQVPPPPSQLLRSWMNFKRYAESLNAFPPQGDAINIPASGKELETLLPKYLEWSARFLDHSAPDPLPTSVLATATAFVATAYPEAGTPAYVTPGEGGLLTYYHAITDQWAHNYRYYILPFGRYDQLWQSLRQSPSLFRDTADSLLPDTAPATGDAALDVVLDRTKPVAAPVVLSSRRLDAATTPSNPAVPAPTWEVVVAQHQEQGLMERNQTVFRRLSYRGIAFTMLRRFAFETWQSRILTEGAVLAGAGNASPAIPAAYPALPDHLPATGLSDFQARSLDIPDRIGGFGQGAMALQWEGLPFYYEHRLLLIAQTDSTVSEVNSIVQRDFEYVSPAASASSFGVRADWQLPAPFSRAIIDQPALGLEIPLKRYFESLPQSASVRWPNERPQDGGPGGVPDHDVVYQIIERFSGNVEMQAEFQVNPVVLVPTEPPAGTAFYVSRQLGKHFLAQLDSASNPTRQSSSSAAFNLRASLLPVTQVEMSTAVTVNSQNFASSGRALSIAGVLTTAGRDELLGIFRIVGGRIAASVAIGSAIPTELQPKVGYPELPPATKIPSILRPQLRVTSLGLRWTGPISARQEAALNALPLPTGTAPARELLLQRLRGPGFVVSYQTDRPTTDAKLAIAVTRLPNANPGWKLTWTGDLTPSDITRLRTLGNAADLPFRAGVDALIAQVPPAINSPQIAPGATVTSSVAGFVIELIQADPIPLPIGRILRLNNPRTGIFAQIRALNTTGDAAFAAAVNDLELQIVRSVSIPAHSAATVAASVGYTPLATQLAVDADKLTWRSITAFDTAPGDLADRVDAVILSGDPFRAAFRELMNNIAVNESTSDFASPMVIAADVLSPTEVETLRGAFGGPDQLVIDRLARNLADKQKIDLVHDGWFAKTAVSHKDLAIERLEPVTFPDPESCRLVWKGTPTSAEINSLLNLPGDALFKSALTELTNRQPTDGVIAVDAALGLEEQIPAAIGNRIRFNRNAAGKIQSFTWSGIVSDEDAAALRRWAQTPQFRVAVEELITGRDNGVVTRTIAPEKPDEIATILQLSDTQLAWLGHDTLTPAQQFDLDTFTAQRGEPNASSQAATLTGGIGPGVVATVNGSFTRRPAGEDLPAVLNGQLTIQHVFPANPPSRVILSWTGRLHSAAQITALRSLTADIPFTNAIQEILTAINPSEQTVTFSTPVEVRPTQSTLPAELQDKLLIGNAVIRYHGIMDEAERVQFRGAYAATPDKEAMDRLYLLSLAGALQDRSLFIGTRRGSAAPSVPVPVQTKALSQS